VNESRNGAIYALTAYFIWGFIPLYFSLVDVLIPGEILAHRIIWSLLFLMALVLASNRWDVLLGLLKNSNNLWWLVLSSLLIATNWLTYIWALQNNQVIDTSLGYYINPMVSVMLGMVFLGERLRPLQLLAVFIAGIGVVHEIFVVGRLPAVALILALTFGAYGLIRKKVAVDAVVGLLVETLFLLPFALGYFFYLVVQQQNVFGNTTFELNVLILGLGLLTTLPLLSFGAAALRLSLTALGFYQYLAPSMVLLLAVFWYGEAFTLERAITFGLILAAVLLFSLEAMFNQRRVIGLEDLSS
jgi:chloramphenicol-sensitive protein RarD